MLIKPLVREPLKHCYKLLTDQDYRGWCIQQSLLGRRERFATCRGKVRQWELIVPDAASFLSAYKEIFVSKIYQFESKSEAPKILDLGANIGLSVLFFKSLYPDAQITAFEADPKIYACLEKNVYGNGFTDVTLLNQAVWNRNGTLSFHSEGADGGHVDDGASSSGSIEVEAIDIREHLEQHRYEFLKIDIEGAEHVVFPAMKEHLSMFRYIFLEYHSRADRPQELAAMLDALSQSGFRFDIQNIMSQPHPFVRNEDAGEFDLQLNVFAWKA